MPPRPNLERPRAARASRGASLGVVAALLGTTALVPPAGAAPTVRLVDIEGHTAVPIGVPLHVTFDVTGRAGFTGWLDVGLDLEMGAAGVRLESQPAMGIMGDDGAMTLCGNRFRAAIAIPPRGSARVDALLQYGEVLVQPFPLPPDVTAEIAWRVVASDGALVGSGAIPLAVTGPVPKRLVVGGPAPPDEPHQAAAHAFASPVSYRPYQATLISSRDFAALEPARRGALLDAVALTRMALLVAGPYVPIDPACDDRLASWRAVVLRTADGTEVREAPFTGGVVRVTNEELATLLERATDDPVRRLATHPSPLLMPPRVSWSPTARSSSPTSVPPTSVALLPSLAAAVVALGLLWLASHPRRRPTMATSLAALIAVASAPILPIAVLRQVAASPRSIRVDRIVHDGRSSRQQHRVHMEVSPATDLRFSLASPRTTEIIARRATPYRQAPHFEIVATPNGAEIRAAASFQSPVAEIFTGRMEPADPPWEVELAWRDGHAHGTATARRAMENVMLLGPGNGLRIGDMAAGERVSLDAQPALPTTASGLLDLGDDAPRLEGLPGQPMLVGFQPSARVPSGSGTLSVTVYATLLEPATDAFGVACPADGSGCRRVHVPEAAYRSTLGSGPLSCHEGRLRPVAVGQGFVTMELDAPRHGGELGVVHVTALREGGR